MRSMTASEMASHASFWEQCGSVRMQKPEIRNSTQRHRKLRAHTVGRIHCLGGIPGEVISSLETFATAASDMLHSSGASGMPQRLQSTAPWCPGASGRGHMLWNISDFPDQWSRQCGLLHSPPPSLCPVVGPEWQTTSTKRHSPSFIRLSWPGGEGSSFERLTQGVPVVTTIFLH
ncbi:hypothetical protein BS47DRAFT_1485573 [Hydnum rufescens UP504]|uniref:Uncharacterized protein n=1 Tax=Hydnum rufescens UP504 TaxID=1448309 RepID=A0A9P6AXH6_9AGAM|nr:hypothetical protein BS47DRAFT_1485573 [Hydnum rufescens UP504]